LFTFLRPLREIIAAARFGAIRNRFYAAPFYCDDVSQWRKFIMVSSAGILMYRQTGPELEVLLVHPGGPFWRNKDEGAWSIPKGEMDEGEDAAVAARREFLEETGCALSGPLEPLGDIRQRGGKRVTAFAVEGDLDVDAIKSNTFEIEWPPKGGRMQSFPEIDRAAWFNLPAAHVKILQSQRQLLDRLVDRAAVSAP
jgi:predicted NUDIX family NTP pyrophosphohydrolase